MAPTNPILESLTPEQLALAEEIAEEYIRDLTQATLPDGSAITRWLDIAYGLYDRKRPDRIEICDSPEAALALASELTGNVEAYLDDAGIGDGGWLAFYDYFRRIEVLTQDEAADVLALRDFSRIAWDSVLLDECAIVVQRPIALKVDDAGNLHCADGPALEWADGKKDFAWHGTWVPERMVLNPRSYTRDEYMAITNTEERRALSESGGWSWVAELLGAKPADEWTDPETGLGYVLLKCPSGEALLAKQSPELKDGAQPRYLEPVHEDLRTARAARKWQATRLTVAECEHDPALSYGVEA